MPAPVRPSLATRVARAATRATWRVAIRLTLLALLLLTAVTGGFAAYAVLMLPDVDPWHTTRLDGEFEADQEPGLDFNGYQAREAALFDEFARVVAAMPTDAHYYVGSRYDPRGPAQALAPGQPYNRSRRLTPPQVRGAALLVHGLSDGPYSMQRIGELLLTHGYEVTIVRLPGHGTLPSMMVGMRLADWDAAVRVAARDISRRLPPDTPFVIAGYSTGATLALSYALDGLAADRDPTLRAPDHVVLISAAIELQAAAALTPILDAFARLPIRALDKVNWQKIEPEYDPYKFTSFPVNASRQVYHATRRLQAQLIEHERAGRLAHLPSVTALQSIVDSTTGAAGVVQTVFSRLRDARHRLVLFDVNRHTRFDLVRRPESARLLSRLTDELRSGTRRHSLTVVTNRHRDTDEVERRDVGPGSSAGIVVPLGLSWPAQLVSMGHVALPFPPDDPIYGYQPGSGANGVASVGSWVVRGEEGAIVLPLGSLPRLRANPFWPVVQAEVARIAGER